MEEFLVLDEGNLQAVEIDNMQISTSTSTAPPAPIRFVLQRETSFITRKFFECKNLEHQAAITGENWTTTIHHFILESNEHTKLILQKHCSSQDAIDMVRKLLYFQPILPSAKKLDMAKVAAVMDLVRFFLSQNLHHADFWFARLDNQFLHQC